MKYEDIYLKNKYIFYTILSYKNNKELLKDERKYRY